jgi:hypothetical protein
LIESDVMRLNQFVQDVPVESLSQFCGMLARRCVWRPRRRAESLPVVVTTIAQVLRRLLICRGCTATVARRATTTSLSTTIARSVAR